MPDIAERRAALQEEIRARTGIDEAVIGDLVQGFYERARRDPLLGPVFAARIPEAEWPAHLERVAAFWSSVALMSGRYHGRPVQAHAGLPIDARHFERWLALFRASARDLTPPSAAEHFIARAERIAQSLQAAIAVERTLPSAGETRP